MKNYIEVIFEQDIYYIYWHKDFYDSFFNKEDLKEAIEYLNVLDSFKIW